MATYDEIAARNRERRNYSDDYAPQGFDHIAAEQQYVELAQAIANKAQAVADGRTARSERYAAVKLLQNNIETLLAWTEK